MFKIYIHSQITRRQQPPSLKTDSNLAERIFHTSVNPDVILQINGKITRRTVDFDG
jgi:hypothetical protein